MREIIDWAVEKINAWVYLDLKVHVIPDNWKSLVMIEQVEGILKRNDKGDKCHILIYNILVTIQKYPYTDIMNFISVCLSVDLGDNFV